ncbi:AraC family transcriptional regulator [Pseudomonas putida]|uniref:helix-turn-helix domain-containing protein n=1 Tax=Pseudomonas putida TaxID=303 RepID=UPI00236415DB|nr:AraC family transcriptional regulator [Pseudomonas putida]MDD1963864.1 AraC family transcriptional regulator [Pseudomonas putida]
MREEHFSEIFESPPEIDALMARWRYIGGLEADRRRGIVQVYLSLIQSRQGQAQLSSWQEQKAKKIMLDNLSAGIQISAVAQGCCLSRSNFSRAFKNTTGYSPRDWLKHARLTRARELLEHTDLSITQVGLDCGFADQAHFTRSFSKAFGMPPKKWRGKIGFST